MDKKELAHTAYYIALGIVLIILGMYLCSDTASSFQTNLIMSSGK